MVTTAGMLVFMSAPPRLVDISESSLIFGNDSFSNVCLFSSSMNVFKQVENLNEKDCLKIVMLIVLFSCSQK